MPAEAAQDGCRAAMRREPGRDGLSPAAALSPGAPRRRRAERRAYPLASRLGSEAFRSRVSEALVRAANGDVAVLVVDAKPVSYTQLDVYKRQALAVLLLLLIAAAVALFVWLTSPDPNRDGLQPDPNVKVGSLSGDFADLDKIVDEGMLTFSINATPAFPDGTSPGNLMIENAEINNNRFTVAIYLSLIHI